MANIRKLKDNIETVRELMESTILAKGNLSDPEIIYMSKLLDKLLNEYNRQNVAGINI